MWLLPPLHAPRTFSEWVACAKRKSPTLVRAFLTLHALSSHYFCGSHSQRQHYRRREKLRHKSSTMNKVKGSYTL
jgi:hypothetical protein